MHKTLPLLLLTIVAPFAVGCQSRPVALTKDADAPTQQSLSSDDTPIAYLDGKPLNQSELYRVLLSTHGGEALAELILIRAVDERLAQEAIEITPADTDAERDILLASLSSDPDQAARLLRESRSQRGLDDQRYNQMLRRNAGLRALVRDQITITDAAIQQAYQLRYGARYQARLITADQVDTLTRLRQQVLAGQSFSDLATEHSTDLSARQGGLLSPISPADPTYPQAIRDALPKLKMDSPASRLSPAIAMDQGYALLWLEAIKPPVEEPTLDAVREELTITVRRDLEHLRMRQLSRTLIDQTNVVPLDPLLDKAWQRQKETLQNP